MLTPKDIVLMLNANLGIAKGFLDFALDYQAAEFTKGIVVSPNILPQFLSNGRYKYESQIKDVNTEVMISCFWYNSK